MAKTITFTELFDIAERAGKKVYCYSRGHEIFWDVKHGGWFYSDNREPFIKEKERPCARCGDSPTKEGHDACLGKLPGVKSACCGHGVEPGYIQTDEEYKEGHNGKKGA